jgi:hypothetical protein
MAKPNYKWDGDSRDERQSVFANSGYSTTAGEFHSTWAQARKRRKRKKRMTSLLWVMLGSVGVSALVLYGVVTHLRG